MPHLLELSCLYEGTAYIVRCLKDSDDLVGTVVKGLLPTLADAIISMVLFPRLSVACGL